MKTLSLVMIVKNEEAVLNRCLNSVKGIVDEIIVVDTGSTDRTKEIALSYDAKIYDYEWNDHFAEARNFALALSTSDWNLVLDADEYVVNDCANEIRSFINSNAAIGRVKRVDSFKDKDGIAHAYCFISRLFPRGLKYSGRIHEQVESTLPRIKINVDLGHDGYFDSRSARNIPLLEMEMKEQPHNPYYHYQIAKEFRGIENFEQCYHHLSAAYKHLTRKENYYPNVVVDYLYAMISSGKLEEGLEVINAEATKLDDFPDFHFVCGQYYLDLILSNTAQYAHMLPQIEQSYLKCLQLGETDRYDSVIGTGSFSALHNLGVYYEVTGQLDKAITYYREAASYQYAPSENRLKSL